MTETARQILSVSSHGLLIFALALIALGSERAPRALQAYAAAVMLGMSALSLNAMVTDPRFGIPIARACAVVAGALVAAMWTVHLVERRLALVARR